MENINSNIKGVMSGYWVEAHLIAPILLSLLHLMQHLTVLRYNLKIQQDNFISARTKSLPRYSDLKKSQLSSYNIFMLSSCHKKQCVLFAELSASTGMQ